MFGRCVANVFRLTNRRDKEYYNLIARCFSNFGESKFKTDFSGASSRFHSYRWLTLASGISGCLLGLYYIKSHKWITVYAKKKTKDDEEVHLSSREHRFVEFASLEYNGTMYMTPRDFLDSVTETHPRLRRERKELSAGQVSTALRSTPGRKKASSKLFRLMGDSGLISYTEYVFLLCVLTNPQASFRIAFNMFDMDGNQRVDKNEFLVIQALILMLRSSGKIANLDAYLEHLPQQTRSIIQEHTRLSLSKHLSDVMKATSQRLEEVFQAKRAKKQEMIAIEQGAGTAPANAAPKNSSEISPSVPDPATQQQAVIKDAQVTTLQCYFFGLNGNQSLTYEDFQKFYNDLQTEVLDIEFNAFSRGRDTISEVDFAKILLRYTVLKSIEAEEYLERVRERIPEMKGITFEQFREFCQFLNNLDDFSVAIQLYTYAGLPISQAEFARAVKLSTNHALDPHLVNTVFQIFDVDGDGQLSYDEFIAVMKDRLHRGFRSHLVQKRGWNGFKSCLKHEMRQNVKVKAS